MVKNYYVHYSYLDTKGNYDASIAINVLEIEVPFVFTAI